MLYVAYPWFCCSRVHLSAKPAAVHAQTFSIQFFSTSVASHLPLEMHPETSAPLCSADKPCRASSSGFWFPLERDLQLTLNLLNPGCPPPKTSFFLQEAPFFLGKPSQESVWPARAAKKAIRSMWMCLLFAASPLAMEMRGARSWRTKRPHTSPWARAEKPPGAWPEQKM